MMKKVRFLFVLLIFVLLMSAFSMPRQNTVMVSGILNWTHISVCEYPMGHFLNYYIVDTHGDEVFFNGNFPIDDSWEGAYILANGEFVSPGWCEVLDVESMRINLPTNLAKSH